jgi:ABC-type branched-subunit amino acid transport system ATPase component
MKLAMDGVYGGYTAANVVRDVSLEVEAGGAYAVIGRNGMGKTTLVRAILGLLPRRSGRVSIGDTVVSGLPAYRIVRGGVAYCAQERGLFAGLSVGENLVSRSTGWKVDPKRRREVMANFPALEGRLSQRAGTLSGGEQKMLMLARALLSSPRLLILDEISAGLQPSVVNVVEHALSWERTSRETTLLMVEQNLSLSMRVADRLGVMKLGSIVEEIPCGAVDASDRAVIHLAP